MSLFVSALHDSVFSGEVVLQPVEDLISKKQLSQELLCTDYIGIGGSIERCSLRQAVLSSAARAIVAINERAE